MDAHEGATDPIARFAAACLNTRADTLHISAEPLRGGLVSRSVQRVVVRGSGGARCAFVAKELEWADRREARIYTALMATPARRLAPNLLGVDDTGPASSWLFLEAIAAAERWPWDRVERAADVLHALARLHRLGRAGALLSADTDWDYERELLERGERLLQLLDSRRRALRGLGIANPVWFVRRFVKRLGRARRRMLALPELPASVIHGDVHSGNVLLCSRAGDLVPVLLDWGRARLGSPLEDVSSWLQSLGFWEPRARQRHDTLLRAYLAERTLSWPPTAELRHAYWVAAASNGLAGAAEWHLLRATDPSLDDDERWRAAWALRDQLRVLRRAHESTRQAAGSPEWAD